MRQKIYSLILTGFMTFGVYGFSFSQDLSNSLIDKIKNEITIMFDKSIKSVNYGR
jgi:hypothetical protein